MSKSLSLFLAKKTMVTFLVTLKEEFHRINIFAKLITRFHRNNNILISQKQHYSNFTETAIF